jgi:hypothetical protein
LERHAQKQRTEKLSKLRDVETGKEGKTGFSVAEAVDISQPLDHRLAEGQWPFSKR